MLDLVVVFIATYLPSMHASILALVAVNMPPYLHANMPQTTFT